LEFNVPFQHKYGYIRDEKSTTVRDFKHAMLVLVRVSVPTVFGIRKV